MGDGNPTNGERVQLAWKHPSGCQKKVFSSSRKVFNNSGLLDAALSALSFILFYVAHTGTKQNPVKAVSLSLNGLFLL